MRTIILAVGAAIATGCGGGRGAPPPVGTEAGPGAAVQQFMQAVADSNLARMAQLWGTPRGSAAETRRPADYQQRVAIMWAYLKGATAEVANEIGGGEGRTVLAVDITRDGCRRRVPFTLVRTSRGDWIVNDIELGLIGVPGRPCPGDQVVRP